MLISILYRWHILTGIATYIFIILVEILTEDKTLRSRLLTDNYAWPVPSILSHDEDTFVEKEKKEHGR